MCALIYETEHPCGHKVRTLDPENSGPICLFGDSCVLLGHYTVVDDTSTTTDQQPCYGCRSPYRAPENVLAASQAQRDALFKRRVLKDAQVEELMRLAGLRMQVYLDERERNMGSEGFLGACRDLLKYINGLPGVIDRRMLFVLFSCLARGRLVPEERRALERLCPFADVDFD